MDAVIGEALGEHKDIVFSKWNPELKRNGEMYHTFTKKILVMPEKIISGFGIEELVTLHHYIIQVFRIPFNEAPTLHNLLRVALYHGLLVNLKVNDLTEGIVKSYKDLHMSDLINYIDRTEYKKLMEHMPDDIVSVMTEALVTASH
jgi:hypothetical protein